MLLLFLNFCSGMMDGEKSISNNRNESRKINYMQSERMFAISNRAEIYLARASKDRKLKGEGIFAFFASELMHDRASLTDSEKKELLNRLEMKIGRNDAFYKLIDKYYKKTFGMYLAEKEADRIKNDSDLHLLSLSFFFNTLTVDERYKLTNLEKEELIGILKTNSDNGKNFNKLIRALDIDAIKIKKPAFNMDRGLFTNSIGSVFLNIDDDKSLENSQIFNFFYSLLTSEAYLDDENKDKIIEKLEQVTSSGENFLKLLSKAENKIAADKVQLLLRQLSADNKKKVIDKIRKEALEEGNQVLLGELAELEKGLGKTDNK